MKKILKYIYFIVIIVLLLSAIGGMMHHHDHEHSGHHHEGHGDKPVVKIGVSLPLTGAVADFGQPVKEAILMAEEEWQAKNTKYDYHIIIEDDQIKPRLISMVGNKFMNVDRVNAIMSMWGTSGGIFTSMNNVSKHPIPHLANAWGDRAKQGEYNFNNETSNLNFAKTMISKLKEENVKNIGFIVQNFPQTLEMKSVMITEMKKAGINIVFDETVNIGEKDYRTLLTKIKDKKVDMIYTQLVYDDLDIFSKQRVETGTNNIPLTGIDMFATAISPKFYEEYWDVLTDVTNLEFDQRILDRNPELKPNPYSMRLYDNLNILITSFENAEAEEGKAPTSEAVLKELQSLKTWDGVSGHLTFEPDGQINSKAKVVYY